MNKSLWNGFRVLAGLSACLAVRAGTDIPLGGGVRGLGGWRPAITGGDTVKISLHQPENPAVDPLVVAIEKTSAERRLVALTHDVSDDLTGIQALEIDGSAQLGEGLTLHPAILLFEKSGGVWVRLGAATALPPPPGARVRVPLNGLRQATFSQDASGEIEWSNITKVWFGFVADGAGAGKVTLTGLRVTDRPFRPTAPAPLLPPGPLTWSVGHDPAVHASIKTDVPGPNGKLCTQLDFQFPGGRHMYVVPSLPIKTLELAAYKGIRLEYKASLPKGIGGLLFMLVEANGAQYYADPPPPPTEEWKTITIPFSHFKHGTWTKDPNGKLDLDQVRKVCVGAHGTATGKGGKGQVCTASIEAVPNLADPKSEK